MGVEGAGYVMTPLDIVDRVCAYHCVSRTQVLSPSRQRHVKNARWEAMWLVRAVCKLSTPAIGEIFHKDHSSVVHACKEIEELVETRMGYLEYLDSLVSAPRSAMPVSMRTFVSMNPAAFAAALQREAA